MGFNWERGDFRRGQSSHNDKVGRAPRWTDQIRAGRLMELGVHAGEWSAAPPAERDYPLAKGGNSTHPHPSELPAGHLGYTYTTLICGAMEGPLHD